MRLWDIATGKSLQVVLGSNRNIGAVAFSPDGQTVAAISQDRILNTWDVSTGQRRQILKDSQEASSIIKFSPDGRMLASVSGSANGQFTLWPAHLPQDALTLSGHKNMVTGVCFSPDGQQVASAGHDGTVRLCHVPTGQELDTLAGDHGAFWSAAFSRDGQRLAGASEKGGVYLWDLAGSRQRTILEGHKRMVFTVAFSPDGRFLASGSGDRKIILWDTETGEVLRELEGHAHSVHSVTFSPDGKRLASASADYTVKVWDLNDGGLVHSLYHEPEVRQKDMHVYSVAFSPDGRLLASACHDGAVRIWDASTGELLRTLYGHGSAVWTVAFSPDGRRLASASHEADGTIKLWDTEDFQDIFTLKTQARYAGLAFSPNGHWLSWTDGLEGKPGSIKLADGRPLTDEIRTEREALNLVQMLFDKPLTKEDVLANLQTNQTISESVRQKALELAEYFREKPNARSYADAARVVLHRPLLNTLQYQFAMAQAMAACKREPGNRAYQGTRGMAHYRLGQYREALDALQQAEDGGKSSENLAFVAMAQHQLGQKDKSLASLKLLREGQKSRDPAQNRHLIDLLEEARDLIERRKR